MAKKAQASHGKLILRPRARIINTIGKDLIRNEVVALVELIKNAYDADASKVLMTFQPPLVPDRGAVVVHDDGFGMDMDTVRSAWMEPATISKRRKRVSPTGRQVTGEKGIGRFAAARIAKKLAMSTIAKGSQEKAEVHFDWKAFDDENSYLDQVECNWSTEPVPGRAKHGTILRLEDLNDPWDGTTFSRLHAELSRLVAPGPTRKDFSIELKLPEEFRHLSGPIEGPAILGEPRYALHGSVSAGGKLTAKYAGPDGKATYSEKLVLDGGAKLSCGPFTFSIDVWDREPEDLEPLAAKLKSTVNDLRKDLNASCGISVYRDQFRILMANSDWLGLDLRRVQNPTLRLSNNQIVASVGITGRGNPDLKDQTNREGIFESPGFANFRDAIIAILSKLEARRFEWRHRPEAEPKPLPGVFKQLEIGAISDLVKRKYGQDKELVAVVERTQAALGHGVKEVQKVVSRYRRLATLGQLVDVILHEGRTPVAAISNEAELLQMDAKESDAAGLKKLVAKRTGSIGKQTTILSALFSKIAPFSGRKRGRPEDTTIEQVLEDAVLLLHKKVKDGKIASVDLPKSKTVVIAHAADLQMIFINLLDNAIYWAQQVPEARRKIKVSLETKSGFPEILVSDDGPGVPKEHARSVFDPYFSLKPDGVGLGLTIAGETATELGGGLELLADGPLRGATFKVKLGLPIRSEDA